MANCFHGLKSFGAQSPYRWIHSQCLPSLSILGSVYAAPETNRLVASGQTRGMRTTSTAAVAIKRLPFSRISQLDLAFFEKALPGRTITDPDVLASSNVDWLKSVRGKYTHGCTFFHQENKVFVFLATSSTSSDSHALAFYGTVGCTLSVTSLV